MSSTRPRTLRVVATAIAITLAGCAGLLGYRSSTRRPFEHAAHLREGVSCLRCHAGSDKAKDQGPLHLPPTATCLSCHAEPHDRRPCAGCHGDPAAAGAAAEARTHLRFSHAIHVPRLSGNCARCHVGDGAERPLRPAMATCLGCHEHDAEFETRRCDGCHVDLAGERVLPASHVVHDGDWLKDHGTRGAGQLDLCMSCHAEKTCAGCHGATTAALPARLGFDDPFAASVHRAGFLARHADESRAAPGTCSSCHAPSSCIDCHAARGVVGAGARSPHPSGWVGLGAGEGGHGPAARRDPASCAGCHGGAGEMLCVGCHKVGGIGGSVHPPGWSSPRATSDIPCRLCHLP
jgi:hypothetical protein